MLSASIVKPIMPGEDEMSGLECWTVALKACLESEYDLDLHL